MPHPEPRSAHPGVYTEFQARTRRSWTSAALAAAGAEWVPDLSEFNTAVDLAAVKNAGAAGVILRAGFGTVREDRLFQARRAEADRVGLPWMAYWFNYPAYNRPQDEAAMFNGAVGPLPRGRGMASDFESDPQALAWPLGQAALDWARVFLTASGPADYLPPWYSSPSFVGPHDLAALVPTWPWWEAEYGVAAPDELGLAPVMWQETSTASVAGVSGPCDLSVMLRGSFASLLYKENPPMATLILDTRSATWLAADPTFGPKRPVNSSAELQAYQGALSVLGLPTAPRQDIPQFVVDAMTVVPGYETFDPNAAKAELNAIEAAVAAPAPVDVAALAAALGPHLAPAVDAVTLATDLAPHLPSLDPAALAAAVVALEARKLGS